MVGAAARFPARLPAAGDFRSVQKQLLALTGPPRELRGGRVQAGEYRGEGEGGGGYARDTLPGWRRASSAKAPPPGAARARPATATPGANRTRSPTVPAGGGARDGEPQRARSSTPSHMLRDAATAPLLAGAAGPALRPSGRPGSRGGQWANRSCSAGGHAATGAEGEEGSSVIREALEQAESDERLLAQSSRCSGGDKMRQVQAALLRERSREALMLLRAERGQMEVEASRAKAKLKDMAAVQRHMQQTIEKQEQQRIRLLADREFVQRHLDSVQDSMQDVLAKAEQTLQLLHAHEQRMAQQAHAHVRQARAALLNKRSSSAHKTWLQRVFPIGSCS